jgi:two-component system, cell cycle response regulator DivK
MNEPLLAGKRIITVEDDVMNLAIVAVLLKHHGALVIQDPFADTINLITKHLPIDVILLDLMLRHHRSGYDIFQQIKAVPELATLPIIAVSASDPAIEIPKTRELGFSGFISKPIDSHKFPLQILDCIEQRPVWA